jgi:hypothetical protein
VCAAFAATVHAHSLGQSESVATVRGAVARMRLVFDLLEFGGVDANGDGDVSYGELDRSVDRIYAALKQHLVVTSDGQPARETLERYAVRDNHVAEFDLVFSFPENISRLTVRSTLHELLQPAHEHVISVSFDGASSTTLLDAATPERTFSAPRARITRRQAALDAAAVLLVGLVLYLLFTRRRAVK